MHRLHRVARPALALGCAAIVTTRVPAAVGGPVLPDFSPSNFTAGAPVDNPFFPLVPGTRYRYRLDDDEKL